MSEHWTLQAPDGSCLYTVDSEGEALKWCESDYGGANVIKPMRVHMAHEVADLREANVKLAGALDMVREAIHGGNVEDLLIIINSALSAHHRSMR